MTSQRQLRNVNVNFVFVFIITAETSSATPLYNTAMNDHSSGGSNNMSPLVKVSSSHCKLTCNNPA